jgi:hypothetical protein
MSSGLNFTPPSSAEIGESMKIMKDVWYLDE